MALTADDSGADPLASIVEQFGLHIGRAMGWPPMAGRAAGVLILSERPLTSAELQEALDAGKGSVSETTRLLMTNGVVERVKEPGSRHFVYRWRDDAWVGCLQHQLDGTTQLLHLAESAKEHGADLSAEQQGRLGEMLEYYRFMVSQLESLLADYTAQWEARRARS